MRKYKGIECGRLVSACLIPLLHIPFSNSSFIVILQQYFARIGVPYFYAVSGMFLICSIEKNGYREALCKYLKRIGKLLLVWVVIYSPFIIRFDLYTIQRLIFKTPAYLWYLTGLLTAAVPFCLVKNRKALLICAAILYFTGTLLGESYKWLMGGAKLYERIFLTTRNGIFFGLPLMCVGELTWKKEKSLVPLLVMSGIALFLEITFVGCNCDINDDRSMYFFIPLFVFFLVLCVRNWAPQINVNYFSGISTAIYVMQYGIITMCTIVYNKLAIEYEFLNYITWLLTIIIPIVFFNLVKKRKIAKILF